MSNTTRVLTQFYLVAQKANALRIKSLSPGIFLNSLAHSSEGGLNGNDFERLRSRS
jgi:hypothetical protein